jgi:hypothetical protein
MQLQNLPHSSSPLLLVIGFIAFTAPAFADGPIQQLYLTAGDQRTNWVVQGSSVVNSFQQNCAPFCSIGGESAIALPGSVRTLGDTNDLPGSEYTFAGVPTGVKYPYPVQGVNFYDGTTDGTHNYSVDWLAGGVYSFDTNWQHPQLLFTADYSSLGITYDPSNNSLWIANYTFRSVIDLSMQGFPLFYFQVPFDSPTALAMDYSDGTLWLGSQTTPGTFYQYSTSGEFLGSVFYSQLASQNTLGGEFILPGVTAPEPGTLALLGTAVAGWVFRKRSAAALR